LVIFVLALKPLFVDEINLLALIATSNLLCAVRKLTIGVFHKLAVSLVTNHAWYHLVLITAIRDIGL
jgi:hypothetical protein